MVTSEFRTRQFSIYIMFMFVNLLCLKSLTQANQIHADDIDHLEKTPLVHEKHIVTQTDDRSILRATGFSRDESKYIRFKATFSSKQCDENATELFVQGVESTVSSHRFHLHNGLKSTHNMDLLISLKNFNFGDESTAYVCAKWKNGMNFVHMGTSSKFER